MNCIHIEWAWRLGITEAQIPRRERGDIEEEEEKGWRRSRRKRMTRKERRSRQSGWISLFEGVMFTRCLVTSKDGFGRRTPKPTCSQLVSPPPPKQYFSFLNLEWLKKESVRKRKMLHNTQVGEEAVTPAFPLSSLPSFSWASPPAAGHHPSQLSNSPKRIGKRLSLMWL